MQKRPEPKVCHYCGQVIEADTYQERFERWGWHLRKKHFTEWPQSGRRTD